MVSFANVDIIQWNKKSYKIIGLWVKELLLLYELSAD